jgi:hypothetical protein
MKMIKHWYLEILCQKSWISRLLESNDTLLPINHFYNIQNYIIITNPATDIFCYSSARTNSSSNEFIAHSKIEIHPVKRNSLAFGLTTVGILSVVIATHWSVDSWARASLLRTRAVAYRNRCAGISKCKIIMKLLLK